MLYSMSRLPGVVRLAVLAPSSASAKRPFSISERIRLASASISDRSSAGAAAMRDPEKKKAGTVARLRFYRGRPGEARPTVPCRRSELHADLDAKDARTEGDL